MPQNSDIPQQTCSVRKTQYLIYWLKSSPLILTAPVSLSVLYLPLLSLPPSFSLDDDLKRSTADHVNLLPSPSYSYRAASSSSQRPWRRSLRSQRPHRPHPLSWSGRFASDSPQFQSSNLSWSRVWPVLCPESDPPWQVSSLWCAGCLNTSSESMSGVTWCRAFSSASSWYHRPSPTACWQEWSPSTVYTLHFMPTSSTSWWEHPDTSLWGSSVSWASWLDR